MAVSNVHINPVAPDSNTSGRYGSSDERARREQRAQEESQHSPSDRLEISKSARETYRHSRFGPDMDFARKALETAPDLTDTRINHIVHRIETGYYRIPSIIWNVVTKIIPALR